MFTLILLVLFSFAVCGWAVVDFRGTHFDSIKDRTESSIKCSKVDYEICEQLKTI